MDEESEAQREETVTSDQEEGGRMVPSSLPPACVLLISCVPLASPFWVSFSPPVKVGGGGLDPG